MCVRVGVESVRGNGKGTIACDGKTAVSQFGWSVGRSAFKVRVCG